MAILLNIAPDHLDRHGDIGSYANIKRRLVLEQDDVAVAIVGVDDEFGEATVSMLRSRGRQNIVPISVTRRIDDGLSVIDGLLFDSSVSVAEAVMDLSAIVALPGKHNWQNAAAAYAAAIALGVNATSIEQAMHSFPGLAHRSEVLAQAGGIKFVNDSKATNVEAALQALGAFSDIHWIAGGRPKNESLGILSEIAGNVTCAYLIGEAQDDFASGLAALSIENRKCGTMDAAFEAAVMAAADGATILLSPACASFDQYRNFEVRGEAFRALVDKHLQGACP